MIVVQWTVVRSFNSWRIAPCHSWISLTISWSGYSAKSATSIWFYLLGKDDTVHEHSSKSLLCSSVRYFYGYNCQQHHGPGGETGIGIAKKVIMDAFIYFSSVQSKFTQKTGWPFEIANEISISMHRIYLTIAFICQWVHNLGHEHEDEMKNEFKHWHIDVQ